VAVLWEFSRAWPLLRLALTQWFADGRPRTARDLRSGVHSAPIFQYGATYPSLLLVFTVCVTYDVIMPVTMLFGAVFFQLSDLMYTFHLV
jgi:hypothetical protein